MHEMVFGPDHPSVAKTLVILAKVCEQTGRTAEAQELSARAQRIRAGADRARQLLRADCGQPAAPKGDHLTQLDRGLY